MKHLTKNISYSIFFLLLFFTAPVINAQPGSEHYHLITSVPIGGEGGWDFLTFDDLGRRLFISHATHVVVYDIDNGKVTGDIANTEGVHGIAIANDIGRGFISNGKSNTVLMFDLKNLDTLKRISVGDKPDAIIYDPFTKIVVVCNGHSNNLSLIEASTGKVKATIPLTGNPEFAASDLKGKVFVNIEDKNEIAEIDMKKFKVLHYWKLDGGDGPTGLAMDIKNHRLFSVCANSLMFIVNSENGKIVSKIPIGKGADAVIYNPQKHVAISSNGDGTATVVKEINANKFEVAETVTTFKGAKTEALDTKTNDLYLITADYGPTPEVTAEHPKPKAPLLPNTFKLLKYGY
jgi:YVTN family beta-propeller protein